MVKWVKRTDKDSVSSRSADRWFRDSNLFEGIKENRHSPSALLSILVFFCLWGGALTLGRFMVTPLIESLPDNTPIWLSFALTLRKVLICGIQILAFFTWVKFVEKRRIATMGFQCRHKAREYGSGFIIGFGSMTIIFITLVVLGAIEIECNPVFSIDTLIGALCIAAFGWMMQSASEEIAIRGWLIPTLGKRYSPLAAVLLTGATFGAIHLLGNGATILSFINLTLSGVFFALYAIRAGNIWGVCGLHFGWNLTQGNIYGLTISGEQSNGSSLLIIDIKGEDVLTGGEFGPEGGCITTLFLACAILLIIFTNHREKRPPACK